MKAIKNSGSLSNPISVLHSKATKATALIQGGGWALLKQRLSWVFQLGIARDPWLYTLLVVEANLAVCRSFLSRNRTYFNSLVVEDQGHYFFLARRASQRPFSQLVFFPGVWPAPLQKRKKPPVSSRRGRVDSFLEDPSDLEFAIKWLFNQNMELTLDTVIDREEVCGFRGSSVVNQELELFVSVEATEHLLESLAFALRSYLFVKYLLAITRGLLKAGL